MRGKMMRFEPEDDDEDEYDYIYPQSLGKKYAPTARSIPTRTEIGPWGAPPNVWLTPINRKIPDKIHASAVVVVTAIANISIRAVTPGFKHRPAPTVRAKANAKEAMKSGLAFFSAATPTFGPSRSSQE
jgi:hypothetical protein